MMRLLDFIDLLTERVGDAPLLIVCTTRPELLERRPTWGGGKGNATTISLTPLSAEATGQFVEELLKYVRLPTVIRQSLSAQADGNPLYAQGYVRMLRDRELLITDGTEWRLADEPGEVPESVHGIIAARLDTLLADERAFVYDAAVVGRTAWVGAVCALSGTEAEKIDDVLHGLERKQLLRRSRRSSVQGEVEVSVRACPGAGRGIRADQPSGPGAEARICGRLDRAVARAIETIGPNWSPTTT